MILALIKLMRPKQWVKNIFVLAPLFFSGLHTDLGAIQAAILAFILFSVASATTYVFNDLKDIEADKLHPKKKNRPLASGAVSKNAAIALMAILLSALVVAFYFLPELVLVLIVYLVLQLAYNYSLKHQAVLDIFTIAFGFVLRVYAGGVAIESPMSSWGFITTFCLALFLASIKRRQELILAGTQSRAVLEVYSLSLITRYAEMSAIGAVIFYSLFVMSERQELVMSIPFVLYGLYRYWYIVEKEDGGESPTDVLFSDWQIVAAVVGFGLTLVFT